MDNVVRYEGMVSFKKDKFDILLTINENSLLFQKKGLFNKKYKVVKEIVIKDIKVLKDVALVEYNNGKMTIHTMNDVFEFFVKH